MLSLFRILKITDSMDSAWVLPAKAESEKMSELSRSDMSKWPSVRFSKTINRRNEKSVMTKKIKTDLWVCELLKQADIDLAAQSSTNKMIIDDALKPASKRGADKAGFPEYVRT